MLEQGWIVGLIVGSGWFPIILFYFFSYFIYPFSALSTRGGCPFRGSISGRRQMSCDAVLPDADAVGVDASPGREISKG
jgi:hypothetical protein